MSGNKSKFILSILLVLNLILFIKLKFFLPQLFGKTQLLDFETYFRLVKDIVMGINPYTVTYMQTLGPPTVFFYFLPFSIFNLATAKFLYSFINIFCGFAACHLLAQKFFRNNSINWFLLLSLFLFSSFPARFSIENGQPNLVICYLVSLLICKPKNKSAYAILSSLIIIKTNYLLVLLSLIRDNLKLFIKTVLTILCILIFLFPIIKPSFYSYYVSNRKHNFFPVLTDSRSLDYYNQSIPARLNTLGYGGVAILLDLIIGVVMLIILYRSQNLLLGIIASIILSPVSWQHYFAVLFPIFVVAFIKIRTKKSFNNLIMLIVSFLFWWVEFPLLHTAQVNFFTASLSSHYLISAIVLFYIIYKNKTTVPSASK